METKICVPIIESDSEKVIDTSLEARELGADLVEVRLDYGLRDFNTLYEIPLPIILTVRPKWEGGLFTGSEADRLASFMRAMEIGMEYVDIELNAKSIRKEVVGFARENNTKVIVSHHNYRGTPQLSEIERVYLKEVSAGADIRKIVTTAKTLGDNLVILKALNGKENAAMFCMGKLGQASRILAPLYGSCITFASIRKGKESAQGQIDISTLKKILGALE